MAGYWPGSFLHVYGRDGVVVHKLAKKYPAIFTGQIWSLKDLLYGFREKFSSGTRRVVPSGQTARVTNHSAEFDSSCPLADLGM